MVDLSAPEDVDGGDFNILVERADPKTVLMTGARGNSLRIAFSTTRLAPEDAGALTKFAKACSTDVPIPEFGSYLEALLRRALNQSHGTILVVQGSDPVREIRGMRDAVTIDPPLDLADAFQSYQTLATADAILELQRSEALLTGMLQSDGIVAFDRRGRIGAYRVFFEKSEVKGRSSRTSLLVRETFGKLLGRRENKAVTSNVPTGPAEVVGGARRRAFEALKPLVGQQLIAALFRSQDGYTEFRGAQI